MWTADINLKSGKNIIVENLQSVNRKSFADSSIKKLTTFSDFYLSDGQKLSFIGKSTVVTISSNEIEYVSFNER